MVTNITEQGLQRLRRFFYAVSPESTSFESIDKVPRYINEAVPLFISFIIVEWVILYFKQGRRLPPLSDGLTSMGHGTFLEVGRLLFRGVETAAYIYVHENFCIWRLPWNHWTTWLLAALGVDLGYYWAHRAVHEINLFWSQHQVHHSSEEYNYTTALRQGMFQRWFVVGFYLPMAFFIPPAHFFVHIQLNQLFQFWIHTELIGTLGPLEFLLNTPSHHRVHHGSNKYCVDKNYGGVLIVWDKLFGTFAAERTEEKPVYGLIEQVNSFNPLYLQFFYLEKVYDKMRSMSGFGDKLFAIVKGPAWTPGSPWTGYPELLPEVRTRKKYEQRHTTWMSLFLLTHTVLVFTGHTILANSRTLETREVWIYGLFILTSLTSLGGAWDRCPWSLATEALRCFTVAYVIASWGLLSMKHFSPSVVLFEIFFTLSACFWLYKFCHERRVSLREMVRKMKLQ